jgi:UDP-2,3-diacylglucosamine pyrophosphatase LpxH
LNSLRQPADSSKTQTNPKRSQQDVFHKSVEFDRKLIFFLLSNRNKGWIIAYWHHPPYTMGSHNSDKEEELVHIRENFIRILERYGVDLIICGHSHDYERSKLMKGHYGPEPSFNPSFLLSNSSGLYDGTPNSCPYLKDSAEGYAGTVYIVSGSAGQ